LNSKKETLFPSVEKHINYPSVVKLNIMDEEIQIEEKALHLEESEHTPTHDR